MAEIEPQPTQQVAPPTAAFVLSLIAGVWMLSMGGMMGGYGMMGGAGIGRPGASRVYGYGGMHGFAGMNGWMYGSGLYGFGPWQMWLGAAAGILVIVGAILLFFRPATRRSWGVVIIVASALDFLLGMGGLVAGVLGIVGGVLALSA